jgi:hypothetical protein
MISYTYQPEVSFTEDSPIEVVRIRAGDSFGPKFYEYYQSDKTCWFWLIVRLKKIKNCFIWHKWRLIQEKNTVVFVFGPSKLHFSIEATNTITTQKLNNVVF